MGNWKVQMVGYSLGRFLEKLREGHWKRFEFEKRVGGNGVVR